MMHGYTHKHAHQCPHKTALILDNWLRKLIHNPYKLLEPLVESSMTVLDFGCGNGFFSMPLSSLVGPSGTVIAVDTHQEMLNRLQNKADKHQFNNISIHKNTDEGIGINQKVDFALAAYIFYELDNQLAYLNELHEQLNDGCFLLLIEPNPVVSKKKFRQVVNLALDTGFEAVENLSVPFSQSILLKKGYSTY